MSTSREELARALRRAREHVRPEDAGLAAGSRRRVPGLRREEVAMLAGISVDYVVRLEQGRGPHPSEQVLGALARALRLSDAERNHVFALAGVATVRPGAIPLSVPASILRLMDRVEDLPAMVVSAKGDVLAWNAMSSAVHGDWSTLTPVQRNQQRLHFLPETTGAPGSPRSRIGGEPAAQKEISRQSVGALRSALGRYPDDEGLRRLIADLHDGSAEFRALWPDSEARQWGSHSKVLNHPSLGEITLDCDTLHVPDVDQLLVVLSAEPGSPGAEALSLLRVIGTQQLEDPATR